MARTEADREDLFAELRTFPLRVEWQRLEGEAVVTGGRRGDGTVAIYFGGDPVYRFDGAGRLRRAFVDGALYRTQGTTLARLVREQTPTETLLKRCDLTPQELAAWLAEMSRRIDAFVREARLGKYQVRRCVPSQPEAASAILEALESAVATPRLAPPIPTRPR
jgi:hypothetical protein